MCYVDATDYAFVVLGPLPDVDRDIGCAPEQRVRSTNPKGNGGESEGMYALGIKKDRDHVHEGLPNRVNTVIEVLELEKVFSNDGLVALGAEAHAQIILKRRQTIFALRSP